MGTITRFFFFKSWDRSTALDFNESVPDFFSFLFCTKNVSSSGCSVPPLRILHFSQIADYRRAIDRCNDDSGGEKCTYLARPDYARARNFKTRSVDSTRVDGRSAARPNPHESRGYVNIPRVRIDIYSTKTIQVFVGKLRERLLGSSSIAVASRW